MVHYALFGNFMAINRFFWEFEEFVNLANNQNKVGVCVCAVT